VSSSETKFKINSPSMGEQFVADYLDHEGITYRREYELRDLKYDSKSFRRPDFKLKKYNVFVEYNGMYNETKEARLRYEEKQLIYFKNNVPCVFLKPEDLGVIEYIFPKKLSMVLRKHEMKKEIFWYNFKLFRVQCSSNLFILLMAICYLVFVGYNWNSENYLPYIAIATVLYQLWILGNSIQNIIDGKGFVNTFR
jgi:hypothetical protein